MLGAYRAYFYGGQLYLTVVAAFCAISLADFLGMPTCASRRKRITGFLALLAIPLALLCAPPTPLWLAIPASTAALLYVFRGGAEPIRHRRLYAAAAILASLTALAAELPYVASRGHVPRPARLFVIGDSLASGGFEEREPWPKLLASQTGVAVENLSLASADATMAIERELPLLPEKSGRNACVLIEIGENDMADGIPLQRFEKRFERLLSAASARGTRRLIMLELTTLPGRWGYGAIQRRLAKRYRCILVPRRILATVQCATGNTSDGVHLTQKGHDEFAWALGNWLGWTIPAG